MASRVQTGTNCRRIMEKPATFAGTRSRPRGPLETRDDKAQLIVDWLLTIVHFDTDYLTINVQYPISNTQWPRDIIFPAVISCQRQPAQVGRGFSEFYRHLTYKLRSL